MPKQLYQPLPQPTQEGRAQLTCALSGAGSARGHEEQQPREKGNCSCTPVSSFLGVPARCQVGTSSPTLCGGR